MKKRMTKNEVYSGCGQEQVETKGDSRVLGDNKLASTFKLIGFFRPSYGGITFVRVSNIFDARKYPALTVRVSNADICNGAKEKQGYKKEGR